MKPDELEKRRATLEQGLVVSPQSTAYNCTNEQCGWAGIVKDMEVGFLAPREKPELRMTGWFCPKCWYRIFLSKKEVAQWEKYLFEKGYTFEQVRE